jgi:ribosomal protein S20
MKSSKAIQLSMKRFLKNAAVKSNLFLDIKNLLLTYSNDDNNALEGDLERLR